MGQEIFYCGTCKILLRSRDLEKGEAFKIADQVYCKACAPGFAQRPSSPPDPGGDSSRYRLSSSRTPRSGVAPSPARSSTPMILGAVGGIVLVVLLAALAAGGPARKPPPPKENPEPPAVVVQPAVEPPPRPEPRPPEPPKPDPREATAGKRLQEARDFLRNAPEDLDGVLGRARAALLEAQGTSVEPEARRFEQEIQAKVAAREERIGQALAAEKFGEAIALLESAKKTAEPARAAAAKAWAEVKEKLLAARKRGADAEAKALAARVEAWGVASLREELARELAAAVEVEPPPEVLAYRKRWSEIAVPFDFAAVLKELEKVKEAAGDLDLLRPAAELAREAPKLQKGQDLKIERFDEAWERRELAGRVLRATAHEVELLAGDERVCVPWAEVAPTSWAALLKASPRAAQIYALLEGDMEGARRHAEPLPPTLAAYGERAARELRSPAETAARKAFADAELAFHDPHRRLVARYPEPSTHYARRLKGLIEERTREGQEVVIGAEALETAGRFGPSEMLKAGATLSMAGDAARPDSFVQCEVELPAGEVRAWIYAGACCLEVFSLGLQAPELSGPNPKDPKETVTFEPGGPFSLPLKPGGFLRAKHAGHESTRETLRWSWIPLPLPKYAAAGPRRLRLTAERGGMSVAYVFLSAGRASPPKEAELREVEASRAAFAALLPPVRVLTGTLLREVWTNVPGSKVADLTSAPGYPERPSSSGAVSIFEGPVDWAENYGTRVRGYVHPPATGEYVFHLAADDDTELWLSPDESPARRVKIAGVDGATKPRAWNDKDAATSAPVTLQAGKRYYVELLHKEGTREDNFAVGWRLPDGTLERPIPGTRLSPFIGGARPARTTLYRAINLNGPPLEIDGVFWEGKAAPDLAFSGDSIDKQDVPLVPAVDGPKARMIRSSVWNRNGLTLTVGGVPSGKYQVYCYIWEDTETQTFDILLNGRVVREKHVSGSAGQWQRVGPLDVDVVDGRLELRTTPGDANVSGLEIWRKAR